MATKKKGIVSKVGDALKAGVQATDEHVVQPVGRALGLTKKKKAKATTTKAAAKKPAAAKGAAKTTAKKPAAKKTAKKPAAKSK